MPFDPHRRKGSQRRKGLPGFYRAEKTTAPPKPKQMKLQAAIKRVRKLNPAMVCQEHEIWADIRLITNYAARADKAAMETDDATTT